MKNRSFWLKNNIYIKSGFTVVGPKEGDSTFGNFFDIVLKDDIWAEKSYEKAECRMMRSAILGAILKSGLKRDELDIILGGDLLNEISATSLSVRSFPSAFLGLYNACSTFGEGMLVGSILLDAGIADNICIATSSHFSTAERQYRFPLELGNQRTPTAQWTVTGSGCSVLSINPPENKNFCVSIDDLLTNALDENADEKYIKDGSKKYAKRRRAVNKEKSNIFVGNFDKETNDYDEILPYIVCVKGGTIGKIVDLGIDDESNMGAAMAPAAADTIITHFKDNNITPDAYDKIFTGDLGRFGRDLLVHLLMVEGIDISDKYIDCGAEYFTPDQKTFQGGSGTGCVNTAFNGYILKQLQKGEIKKALVVPTGALLNKDTPLQNETIPGIAHAFVVEAIKRQ